MAPFIASVRKQGLKTRFKRGILTRALKCKRLARLKRMYRTLDTYTLQCLEVIFPQSSIKKYLTVGRSSLDPSTRHIMAELEALLTTLAPTRLEEKPTPAQCESFCQWLRAHGRRVHNRERGEFKHVHMKLQRLSLHMDYTAAVANDYAPQEKELFERWLECVRAIPRGDARSPAARATDRLLNFQAFLVLLEELYDYSGTRDITLCGSIPIDLAGRFCTQTGPVNRNEPGIDRFLPVKAQLLQMTGYRGEIEELRVASQQQDRCAARFHELQASTPGLETSTLNGYMTLRQALGRDPAEAGAMSEQELVDCLRAYQDQDASKKTAAAAGYHHAYSVRRLFHLLTAELEHQGCTKTCEALRMALPTSITGGTHFDQMRKQSPWRAQLLERALENILAHSTRSAFPEQNRKFHTTKLAWALRLLEEFVKSRFGKQIADQDPLQWLLANATQPMLKDYVMHVMQRANENHMAERVKSANDAHSASMALTVVLRVLKVGLADDLPAPLLQSLNRRKLLASVPNAREPADPMKRRTIDEAEMDAMLNVCQGDTKLTLLLVLLSEIGLRHTALMRLKYYDLMDGFHKPRRTTSVMEKGRAVRSFILSERAQQATSVHCKVIRDMASDTDLHDFHVFNLRQPSRPVSAPTLTEWLSDIAKKAGVSEVRVHAHCFRHTIVGRLMDAGNSLETVSKYMGHKSLDTTSTHYWVANVQELHETMINPMSGAYQEEVRDEEMKDLEIRLLREKKAKALEIIETMLTQLHDVKEDGGSLEDYMATIKASIPNLSERLLRIEEDEGADEGADAPADSEHA
jgi:integrase